MATQQAGGEPTSYTGPLKLNFLPASSPAFTATVNDTFNFDVEGSLQGSRAVMAITTAAGVFTTARVINGGENFISGDVITISQNDLQAAGFANANRDLIFDVFPDYELILSPHWVIWWIFKSINEPSLTWLNWTILLEYLGHRNS